MNKRIIWILTAIIILGFISLFFYRQGIFSKEILKLEIFGPESAKIGEEIEYTVQYKNNGNFVLQKTKLIFELPENSLTEDEKRILTKTLGDIYPGQQESVKFKGRLLGKDGDLKTARASLSYIPKNITATYESRTSFITKIDASNINLNFDLPTRAEQGKTLTYSINYFSNIDYPLEKLSIKVETTQGFEIISSVPKSLDNQEWKLETLNKTQGGRITINGKVLANSDQNLMFNASLGMWQNGNFIVIKQANVNLQVINPMISIFQQVNGSNTYVASPGETLRYQVFFTNIGLSPFNDLFMAVKLDGNILDMSSVLPESNGQVRLNDNMIVWDSSSTPYLKYLGPQQEGVVAFSVKVKNDWAPTSASGGGTEITNEVSISQTSQKFTTSTLQQAAWQRFKFSSKATMALAQKLYEEGHITYHRTDSLNLAESSLLTAKNFITQKYGHQYWAGKIVKYKTKNANAQEAHEAIRPTYPDKTPESLSGLEPRQLKLYTLIWQRFIACQMAPAVFDSISADIQANNYTFRATGQTLKFDGFLKIYSMKFEENSLPPLEVNDNLDLAKLTPLQHFTEPPARYTEATLIKTLEKYGIGRPSTYAPIISNIQDRNYVSKNEQKKFFPTEIGIILNDVLVKNFPNIINVDFTAKMEKELDEIAEGKDTFEKTCKDFYNPFSETLEIRYKDTEKTNLTKETNRICPKCGSSIIERMGRFGRFYACSKFPECKHTESIENGNNNTGVKCPKCKGGEIVARKTKRGKIFYGCNKFPKCDFALWDKPINEFCPKCDSILVQKNKSASKCSNKDCDYVK